ncbi:MAG TPA: glycosyltransferase family 39 protein [Solirubrobacterales bacterium]|nr:glycosyltransferase family 39 protein [Solirubrobacterales bacterium]
MEAASLPRRQRGSLGRRLAAVVRARSRVFWVVAGLTALGAALRFATLGLQSYHHDEIVTASRVLRVGFGHAMDAVGFSESAPPLYYALAWVWTQFAGNGEWGLRSLSAFAGVATIPVAYLIGRELRGSRAGVVSAALVAVNPMLIWYSQEARAYALLAFFCALSLYYCVRALRDAERRSFVGWGIVSALALATHYFAAFPLLAEAVLLLRRRGRAALPGFWIVGAALLLLAPLAIHQMSYGHAEWIGKFSLGHRIGETAITFTLGETGDIIGRSEQVGPALFPLYLVAVAIGLLLLRGTKEERRAALVPFAVGATALGIPLLLAVASVSKDFVLARNLLPALVPLLVAVAIALTGERTRRLGNAVAGLLVVYSLAFSVWVNFDEDLQRPDWHAVAAHLGEPEAPRATVTWVLGEAPLRFYLSTGAIQLKAVEGYDWLVREIDFVSEGPAPPPPRRLLGPGFREVGQEDLGRLFVRRYRLDRPGLAPLRLRELRKAQLNWRNNGVLLDGVGPD